MGVKNKSTSATLEEAAANGVVELQRKRNVKSKEYRKQKRLHHKFRRTEILGIQSGLLMLFVGIALFTTTYLDDNNLRVNRFQDNIEEAAVYGDTRLGRSLLQFRQLDSSVENITLCLIEEAKEKALQALLDAEYEVDDNYPPDPWSMSERRGGAIIFHICAMIYMFIGLAIVCDEYFEPALAGICEHLHLKEDVAGATFMAAGGSAPELFTSLMGVFVATSDIGFGTIVGSAVFNVLFVIAICAFVTNELQITWWPITRDSVFYCFSIVVLVKFAFNQEINWLESLTLLMFYFLYVTIMAYNEELEQFVTRQLRLAKEPKFGFRKELGDFLIGQAFSYFIYAMIMGNVTVIFYEFLVEETDATAFLNNAFNTIFIFEMLAKMCALGFFGYWTDALNAFDGVLVLLIFIEFMLSGSGVSGGLRALRIFRFLRALRALRIVRLYRAINVEKEDATTQYDEQDFLNPGLVEEFISKSGKKISMIVPKVPISGGKIVPMDDSCKVNSSGEAAPVEEAQEDDDDDDDEPANPFEVPDGTFNKCIWLVSTPLSFGMYFTIPDCRREVFKKWFFVTFLMCIAWIMALSYVMVWMATVFGRTVGISESIMGLTLLAAGTSIPDLLSSVAVAKRGFGDMAVSSSIGSNVFDILVGLPVPWLLSTGIIYPGSTVQIKSDSLTLMILTLFLMVAAVVSLIHLHKWKLTKRLGVWMVALYFLFMIESVLLEAGLLFGESCL